MQNWKTTGRKVVLKRDRWLTVEDHSVELPDGRVIPDWPWIITPDYINVLAVTEEDQFLCFRQTKYAIEGQAYAPVGGYVEAGEDPLVAAQRELQEELGYQASDWIFLGKYVVDANRGSGNGYLYLARNATFVGHAESDDLEEMEPVKLTREELRAALRAGEFKALSWAATVALALERLS
ncbi:MAG TPA: NUDIX hydrolase [Chloroflexia bacterium]|nr:NUDIX hydrolase [Chloroflexia bacterium]